jgi:hypothetical protein
MEMPVDTASLVIFVGAFIATGLIVLLDWMDMRKMYRAARDTERREEEAKKFFEQGDGK